MNHTTKNSAAAEKAALIKTAFDGSDDPGNDNATRVKGGAEAFSKADASAEASKPNNSTETAEKASDFAAKMVEKAQKLGRQGGSVFPIAAGAKIPPITGWQELATTDPDKIRRLWTQEYWNAAWLDKQLPRERAMAERAERIRKVEAAPPGKPKAFNIGIFTGAPLPNGRRFFALDFDKKGGKTKKGDVYDPATAQERRDQLIAKVGKENLPPTPLARTATGGAHAIYACPIGVEVASDVGLIPGVDVRGRGAYIVGPGSVIDGGGEYVWAKSLTQKRLELSTGA
jgi:Bifunctional DNA primase/polymerase, N-terminal